MSTKYPGGIITKNYVAPTTTSASGIWTLEQQEQAQQAGIWPFGGPFNYIEDVFSTYLYTGNSSTQSIVNNIDLSTKGGMVWTKSRNAAYDNTVYDTVRGTGSTKAIYTDDTSAQGAFPSFQDLTAYNTNGYSIGSPILLNETGINYASWTFRKQPKFFDIVTYTGNSTNRTISHNLGSTPGCIIVKSTTQTSNWQVYHRGLTSAAYGIQLNSTAAQASFPTFWNSTAPTSTEFSIGTSSSVNLSGESFVAYIFAHDSGGFGLAGTDNVISCGSFTASGGIKSVDLGYEPQWLLVKRSNGIDDWQLFDNMRGMTTQPTYAPLLRPNSTAAEATGGGSGAYVTPTATGFDFNYGSTATYIYIAIRRGPMKVPTDATKVFDPEIYTGNDVNGRLISSGFPVDTAIIDPRNGYATPGGPNWFSRLTGNGLFLQTASTNAEKDGSSNSNGIMGQDGITVARTGTNVWSNVASNTYVSWFMRRAPSFFDEVCWTGTNADQNLTHNLTVVPEFIIYRTRATSSNWYTAYSFTSSTYGYSVLNLTAAPGSQSYSGGGPFSAQPTTTQFSVGQYYNPTSTLVAYLFATCAGVSKVGTYTGNGTTQTINCGFTGGARFVLIKRTDSTGDWYVYDTARGMTVLTDPYLLLNSTAAETATLGSVTTVSTGFALNASILSAINTNAATYIFLAIA